MSQYLHVTRESEDVDEFDLDTIDARFVAFSIWCRREDLVPDATSVEDVDRYLSDAAHTTAKIAGEK